MDANKDFRSIYSNVVELLNLSETIKIRDENSDENFAEIIKEIESSTTQEVKLEKLEQIAAYLALGDLDLKINVPPDETVTNFHPKSFNNRVRKFSYRTYDDKVDPFKILSSNSLKDGKEWLESVINILNEDKLYQSIAKQKYKFIDVFPAVNSENENENKIDVLLEFLKDDYNGTPDISLFDYSCIHVILGFMLTYGYKTRRPTLSVVPSYI